MFPTKSPNPTGPALSVETMRSCTTVGRLAPTPHLGSALCTLVVHITSVKGR